jgi:hypothetical protein
MWLGYSSCAIGVALESVSREPGSHNSDDLTNPDFSFAYGVIVFISVTETTGEPSLNCWLETSADDGVTWTPVNGTNSVTLTAPGSAAMSTFPGVAPLRVASNLSGAGAMTYGATVLVGPGN